MAMSSFRCVSPFSLVLLFSGPAWAQRADPVEAALVQTDRQLQRKLSELLAEAAEVVIASERAERRRPSPNRAVLDQFRRDREQVARRQIPDWVLLDPKNRHLADRLLAMEEAWVAALDETRAGCLERRQFEAASRAASVASKYRNLILKTKALLEDVPAETARGPRRTEGVVPLLPDPAVKASSERGPLPRPVKAASERFATDATGPRPAERPESSQQPEPSVRDTPNQVATTSRTAPPPSSLAARLPDPPVPAGLLLSLLAALLLTIFFLTVFAVGRVRKCPFGEAFGRVVGDFGRAAAEVVTAVWKGLVVGGSVLLTILDGLGQLVLVVLSNAPPHGHGSLGGHGRLEGHRFSTCSNLRCGLVVDADRHFGFRCPRCSHMLS
jgi:hypothetical protein